MATHMDDGRLLTEWCWLNILNGVILVLDEQSFRKVRWYYNCIGACLNLYVSLISIRCTMKPSQMHNPNTLQCRWHADGSWLMLIEYMERCRIGFGWTVLPKSTLVFIGVGTMFEFEGVIERSVYDAPWHDHNCTLVCYSTTTAMPHGRFLHDVDWIYGTVPRLLRKNREYVGINWCIIEYEGVNSCCAV